MVLLYNDLERKLEAPFSPGESELILMFTCGTRSHIHTPPFLFNKLIIFIENLTDLQGKSLYSQRMV